MSGSALGDRGEALAAQFLEARGWRILERNYRVGRKEVDLIARRDDVVAFVEVKSRRSGLCGHPLEAITPRKQREIAEVASAWMHAHGDGDDLFRFDAVAITFDPHGTPQVEHVEDAWGI